MKFLYNHLQYAVYELTATDYPNTLHEKENHAKYFCQTKAGVGSFAISVDYKGDVKELIEKQSKAN